MKRMIGLVLLLAMLLSLCACGSGGNTNSEVQKAEFDSTVTSGNFEITVDKDIVSALQLNGDKTKSEFLTTDLSIGDGVQVAKDDHILVVVSYAIKNIGKEKSSFEEIATLNYNNGYTYEAGTQYYVVDNTLDNWKSFTSVDINPLSNITCKAFFAVPKEVIDNEEATLVLTIANYEYSIR